jgi:hypothetical protein
LREQAALAEAYLKSEIGEDDPYLAVNSAIWKTMEESNNGSFELDAVWRLSEQMCLDADHVFAVLGLLSASNSRFLEMQFVDKNGGLVSNEDVYGQIRSWRMDKSLHEDDWKAWASRIYVRWVLNDLQGA